MVRQSRDEVDRPGRMQSTPPVARVGQEGMSQTGY